MDQNVRGKIYAAPFVLFSYIPWCNNSYCSHTSMHMGGFIILDLLALSGLVRDQPHAKEQFYSSLESHFSQERQSSYFQDTSKIIPHSQCQAITALPARCIQ